MEFLGAVSAGVTLFGALDTCSRNVRKCYRDIQYARAELRTIRDELSICRGLAAYFDEVTNPIKGNVEKMRRQHKLDEKIKQQGLMAQGQVESLLNRMEPLRDGTKASLLKQCITKCKWHFFKEDIQLPMATLASIKSSLVLLTVLLVLDGKISEMARTPKANAGERLTILNKIRGLKEEVHRQETRLQRSMIELQRKLDEKGSNRQTFAIISNIKDITTIFQEIEQQQFSKATELLEEMPSLRIRESPMRPTKAPIRRRKPSAATTRSTYSPPSQSHISTALLGFTTHEAESSIRRHQKLSSSDIHIEPPVGVNHGTVALRRDDPTASTLKTVNQSTCRLANPSAAKERSSKLSVYHDYGDGSRECYERDLRSTELNEENESDCSGLTSTGLSQKYSPMPPFDTEDLKRLKGKRKRAVGHRGTKKHSRQ